MRDTPPVPAMLLLDTALKTAISKEKAADKLAALLPMDTVILLVPRVPWGMRARREVSESQSVPSHAEPPS